MATIKALKKKVKITKGTLQITTAMKLVSAARLNRSQDILVHLKKYMAELEELVCIISALSEKPTHNMIKISDNPHSLLLVVSSEKGLCGSYNTQLKNKVQKFIAENVENYKTNTYKNGPSRILVS